MIDNVKIRFSPEVSFKHLDFKANVNMSTGEIIQSLYDDPKGRFSTETTRYKHEHMGMTLFKSEVYKVFTDGRELNMVHFELRGSIHKFANKGIHNYDVLTFQRFTDALSSLCDYFKFHPSTAKLIMLEFGVNINLPLSTSKFLKAIKCYKRKQFSESYYPDTKAKMLKFCCEEYELKLYEKGKQYQKRFFTANSLFRYEIKATTLRYIKSLGIRNLEDLLGVRVWREMEKRLKDTYKQIIFFKKERNLNSLSNKKMELVLNMNDRNFWLDIDDRKKFDRFKKHVETYSEFKDIKSEVSKLIEEESQKRILLDKKGDVFHTFESSKIGTFSSQGLSMKKAPLIIAGL